MVDGLLVTKDDTNVPDKKCARVAKPLLLVHGFLVSAISLSAHQPIKDQPIRPESGVM
jgi:hypothetical protein